MCDHNSFNRRTLVQNMAQYSAVAGITSLIGSRAFALPKALAPASSSGDPHYFLHINIPAGLDASYLFDARPLSMTKDGLIANYHGKEPIVYTGDNGQSTLRTSLTDPIMKYKDRFSVVNGVVMSPSLDGHDQMMNVLLTGNPFGGDSFLSWTSSSPLAMDFVSTDNIFADLTNSDASMALSPEKCRTLAEKIDRVGSNGRMTQFIQSRAHNQASGKSSLAASSRRLDASMSSIGDFSSKMSAIKIPANNSTSSDSDKVKFIKKSQANIVMLSEFMRVGLTNAGVLILQGSIDSHDPTTASKLPETLGMFYEAIASAFDYLASVPSPSGRSMLDDTTFLIGSEFSRTMRQPGVAIDKTGTDHNPLTNTLVVGGKGIRGGLVLGASDYASSSENLSGAHLTADPGRLKIMGRPFDIDSCVALTDVAPQSFDPLHYLGASNVTNTIQEVLGIPANRRYTYGRNLPVAKALRTLIA